MLSPWHLLGDSDVNGLEYSQIQFQKLSSFEACSSHVCRNVRLGSLLEHCSCLFGHVLLIAIDLIFFAAFHCVTKTSRTIHCVAETARAFHCVAEHREHFTRLCCRNSASLLLCCRTIASIIQPWKDRAGSSEAVQAAGVICKLKLYVCMFILCVSCCMFILCVACFMWCVCILLQLLIRLFSLWPLSVLVLLCLLSVVAPS